MLDQLPALADTPAPGAAPSVDLPKPLRPRPVILGTIEISDPLLRSRGLDLFALFREDGQHDRLDTVISEAMRTLRTESGR